MDNEFCTDIDINQVYDWYQLYDSKDVLKSSFKKPEFKKISHKRFCG